MYCVYAFSIPNSFCETSALTSIGIVIGKTYQDNRKQ